MPRHANSFAFAFTILFALLIAACAPTAAPTAAPLANAGNTELIVFAAASLTGAFGEIGKQFEASHPGVKVVFNFAGSQQLSAQLTQGAQADVFASANAAEMQNVMNAGAASERAQDFASNRLVVILPADNPGKITSLRDLAKPGIKLVIGDKSVPVGSYALAMFDKMSADPAYGKDFGPTALKNVVSQENNVQAIVTKIALGEADAGIVYVTDVTPDIRAQVATLAVLDSFNQIARYPIVVLKQAPQPELAKQFVQFVLAPDGGQAILRQWNFLPAPIRP